MASAPDIVWRFIGVALVLIGVLIVIFSDAASNRLRNPSDYPIQSTVIIAVAVALVVGAGWWNFIAKMETTRISGVAILSASDRPPNSVVAGINWHSPYTEIILYFSGSGSATYEDLDIVIGEGIFIAGAGQSSGPEVQISNKHNVTIRAELLNPTTGRGRVLPSALLATDAGYRIKRERLRGGERIDLILAAVTLSTDIPQDERDRAYQIQTTFTDNETGEKRVYSFGWADFDDRVFGESPTPNQIRIVGSYRSGNSTRVVDEWVDIVNPLAAIRADLEESGRTNGDR